MQANWKSLTADNTTSKIAEMVIQGSTMGITKMTKVLHEYGGGNPEINLWRKSRLKPSRPISMK